MLLDSDVLLETTAEFSNISQCRYGDQVAEAATEGLDAAGHAIGTAWAVFKIRKAIDPKSSIKPTTLARSAVKAAAAEIKANKNK